MEHNDHAVAQTANGRAADDLAARPGQCSGAGRDDAGRGIGRAYCCYYMLRAAAMVSSASCRESSSSFSVQLPSCIM